MFLSSNVVNCLYIFVRVQPFSNTQPAERRVFKYIKLLPRHKSYIQVCFKLYGTFGPQHYCTKLTSPIFNLNCIWRNLVIGQRVCFKTLFYFLQWQQSFTVAPIFYSGNNLLQWQQSFTVATIFYSGNKLLHWKQFFTVATVFYTGNNLLQWQQSFTVATILNGSNNL
jgi:hypothetical protein